MGKSMAGHLIDAGYKATVYSRTLSKCEALKEKGAKIVHSPKEVVSSLSIPNCCVCLTAQSSAFKQAQQSDVVFLIVGYPSDVRQVVLGPDGIMEGLKPGGIIVDMTTSEPALAQEIFEAGKAKGISTIDAPVSGGDVGARNATLSIMVRNS